jgi:hypothetical protein
MRGAIVIVVIICAARRRGRREDAVVRDARAVSLLLRRARRRYIVPHALALLLLGRAVKLNAQLVFVFVPYSSSIYSIIVAAPMRNTPATT